MSRKPPPPAPAAATLGDVLRRQGVQVGEGAPTAAPTMPPAAPIEPIDFGGAAKLVVRREKKGRGGKTATLIEGMKLPPSALERIARDLKRALGCGATLEGSTIVLQGDLTPRVIPWLQSRGAKKVVAGN